MKNKLQLDKINFKAILNDQEYQNIKDIKMAVFVHGLYIFFLRYVNFTFTHFNLLHIIIYRQHFIHIEITKLISLITPRT